MSPSLRNAIDGKGNYYTEMAKANKSHLAMGSLWFGSVGQLSQWDRFKTWMYMQLEDGGFKDAASKIACKSVHALKKATFKVSVL